MDKEIKKIKDSKITEIFNSEAIIEVIKDIKNGNNWRHKVFYNMPMDHMDHMFTKSHELGYYFDAGGFTDLQLEQLMDLLSKNNPDCSGDYIAKVLLPEVLVKVTEIVCMCNRTLAES